MATNNLDLFGRAAYEAYRQSVGGRSAITGDELPGWDDQQSKIREAWRASAGAVLMLAALTQKGKDDN